MSNCHIYTIMCVVNWIERSAQRGVRGEGKREVYEIKFDFWH